MQRRSIVSEFARLVGPAVYSGIVRLAVLRGGFTGRVVLTGARLTDYSA